MTNETPPNNDIPTDNPSPSPEEINKRSLEVLEKYEREQELLNPPPVDNNLARPLVEDMRNALFYDRGKDMITQLENQAAILDTAFRRLLSDADITYKHGQNCNAEFSHYAAAFKAQELYCKTARAINILKNKKKIKKQKPQRVERTNGFENSE